jgi:nucleoside-diphosphate-sugar epimerase
VRDARATREAVRGCRRVYHCAAKVSSGEGQTREIHDCNVLGTRHLLRAALDTGVERVVVTGSFSAVGWAPGRPSDERMPADPFERMLPYARSKMTAEQECLRAAADGLDVVIATSCAIVGPHDFKPSRMGRVLLDSLVAPDLLTSLRTWRSSSSRTRCRSRWRFMISIPDCAAAGTTPAGRRTRSKRRMTSE